MEHSMSYNPSRRMAPPLNHVHLRPSEEDCTLSINERALVSKNCTIWFIVLYFMILTAHVITGVVIREVRAVIRPIHLIYGKWLWMIRAGVRVLLQHFGLQVGVYLAAPSVRGSAWRQDASA